MELPRRGRRFPVRGGAAPFARVLVYWHHACILRVVASGRPGRPASCSCEAHECGAELSREGHQWIAAEWPLAHRAPWSNSLPPLRHCDRVGVFVASPALFSLPPTYLLKFPYGH